MSNFEEIKTLKHILAELDEALNYYFEQGYVHTKDFRMLERRYRIINKAIKELERLAK